MQGERRLACALLCALAFAGCGSGDELMTIDRVVAAGAEVMQEPMEQSYGVIDCAFRDPSGNHIRISQMLPG